MNKVIYEKNTGRVVDILPVDSAITGLNKDFDTVDAEIAPGTEFLPVEDRLRKVDKLANLKSGKDLNEVKAALVEILERI